jgi:diacylglycerol O-acyltransferase
LCPDILNCDFSADRIMPDKTDLRNLALIVYASSAEVSIVRSFQYILRRTTAWLDNKMAIQVASDGASLGRNIVKWLYLGITFIAALFIVPWLLPVTGMFRMYRSYLIQQVKKKHGADIMVAPGNDAIWLQNSDTNRAIINTVFSLKGQPDLVGGSKLVMERMIQRKDPDDSRQPLFPKLTKYCTSILGIVAWVEEQEFKIEEHIYMHDTRARNKAELQEQVGRLCSRGMRDKRSPWEVIVFEPMDNSDVHVCVFRVHHSIGDGISLVKAFVSCLVDDPPAQQTSQRFGAKGSIVLKIAKSVLEGPGIVLQRLLQPADASILHGPELSGTKIVAWTKQIDLELIKRIKNATGTTVNDVLLSCLARAYGQYMREHASSPPTDLCSLIPIDIRRSHKLQMDNQFAAVHMDLPLNEDDPIRCLRIMKARMDGLKASSEPLVNNLLIGYCMERMPNWLSSLMLDRFSNKCSMVVSNVPGPAQPLSINGMLVDDLLFWPPMRKDIGKSTGLQLHSKCHTPSI